MFIYTIIIYMSVNLQQIINPNVYTVITNGIICFFGFVFLLDYIIPKYCNITYFDPNNIIINKINIYHIINVLINLMIFCFAFVYISNYLISQNIILDHKIELIKLLINYIMTTIFFYYSHIIFHYPKIYKYIHKKHHELIHPSAFFSIYATHIEFIIGNCFTVLIPCLITLSHPYYFNTFILLSIINVTHAHISYRMNGYLYYIFDDTYFHYIHHDKFIYNYGLSNNLLDKLHGTLYK